MPTLIHKHTPGPWENYDGDICAQDPWDKGEYVRIATINKIGISHSEIKANINLIEAAPDMLKLLQELSRFFNSDDSFEFNDRSFSDDIHAVLQKAEGKTV